MTLDPAVQKLLSDALVALLTTILSYALVLLIGDLRDFLQHKLTQAQMQTVEHWVKLGAFAAEQYLKSADGQAKKEWALTWIQNQLTAHGIPFDVQVLSDMIEGIVGQEKLNLQTVHLPDYEGDAASTAAPAPARVLVPVA